MNEIELPIGRDDDSDIWERARLLRALFDTVVDSMSAEMLGVVRDQCLGAERTAANLEIVATIDRRLAALRASPPRGS